jgi:hypothetical protein
MPRQRNYRKEYEQRIAKATKEGRSRASGRGHPSTLSKAGRPETAERLAKAYELMKEQKMSATKAAKAVHVSRESMAASLRGGGGRKENVRWVLRGQYGIKTTVFVETERGAEVVTLILDPHNATIAGEYLAAVSNTAQHNDSSYLDDVDDKITDINGATYTLVMDSDRINDLISVSDIELFVSDKPMAH